MSKFAIEHIPVVNEQGREARDELIKCCEHHEKTSTLMSINWLRKAVSDEPWEKSKHKNNGKNHNNPAVRLAEQKRKMRAEKLKNRGLKWATYPKWTDYLDLL